ncbi:type II toxin-antitoxin system RelE/ParE family toxin [Spirillospora sp. NPDC047279]|uniref:type II toxin-antitoxin system RelE/ParE family toxin n=1 Tax=Spirillospora sp. NPDC047279 TaxID=3155478 RepID=UPI003401684C
MSLWEISLEPEVESWLEGLSFRLYQRVMRNVDHYLVTGGVPDGDHVKKLQDADGVHELRVALDRTTWRLTFWKPASQAIVILTVFRKTQTGTQAADIDRAMAAKKRCEAEHDLATTHLFERSEQ